MTTYGKKNPLILPSFSTLRGSVATQKFRKEKVKNGEPPSLNTSNFNQSNSRQPPPSQYDDSIDELASMLLDDATVEAQPKGGPGKRLSQLTTMQTLPNMSSLPYHDNKSLPQLPQLLFNGDDAWALKTVPAVTAAGSFNEVHFGHVEEVDIRPPLGPPHVVHHARQGSGPPIPRKSSKRRSARPKTTIAKAQAASSEDADATGGSFNGGGGPTYEGPYVPAKKRRLKDSKFLIKFKATINERLQARSVRRRHDSLRDDRLLDSSLSEMPDFDEEDTSNTPPSMWEIRMNEGDNFKKLKVNTLTGHGISTQKPITGEGRSLKSRKSAEDPFSERPHSHCITRMPTNFENRLKDDISIDQETIPDLPSRTQTPKSGLVGSQKVRQAASFEATDSRSSGHTSEVIELPNRSQTPKNDLLRAKMTKNPAYEADFDALFSSSPLAQSTPRIRLEPTFEDDGKRMLKSVPAESRSLFDSDMEIDTEPTVGVDTVGMNVGLEPNSPRQMKKHPSPSKTELEGLERAMRQFTTFPKPAADNSKTHKYVGHLSYGRAPAPVLGKKDANARLQEGKARGQCKLIVQKSDTVRTTVSMSNIARPRAKKSFFPKFEKKDAHPSSAQNEDALSHSMMEIDELQWDASKYNIGMRRV